MRRYILPLLVVGLLALASCAGSPALVPVAPAPPGTVPPPVLPPVVAPPVVPPELPPVAPPEDAPAGPDFPRSALDALVVGMTAAEVADAVGSEPIEIPPGPTPTARWYVTTNGEANLLWVVFDEGGRLRDRGLSPIVTIPRRSE